MSDNLNVQVGVAPVAVRFPSGNQENQIITNAGPSTVLLEGAANYVLTPGGSGFAAVTPGIPFPPGSRLRTIKNNGAIWANTTGLGPVVASPAVPATTVNATNNTSGPVAVTIGGTGTITAVVVNGVTVLVGTNLTGSVVAVPAGGTISLTYSAGTPTWVWNQSQIANLQLEVGIQAT